MPKAHRASERGSERGSGQGRERDGQERTGPRAGQGYRAGAQGRAEGASALLPVVRIRGRCTKGVVAFCDRGWEGAEKAQVRGLQIRGSVMLHVQVIYLYGVWLCRSEGV